jgi:lipopolysaccharide transport system permease protein
MTVWLWITPVMIGPAEFPVKYHFLMDWNPMSWIVNAYRFYLLPNWPDPSHFTITAACAVATFIAGGLFFRHLKRGFADVL